VTPTLNRGDPPRIVAASHGRTLAISLGTYSDTKADELRAAGAAVLG
jgi:hypothetical protein